MAELISCHTGLGLTSITSCGWWKRSCRMTLSQYCTSNSAGTEKGLLITPGYDAPVDTQPEKMEDFIAAAHEFGKP